LAVRDGLPSRGSPRILLRARGTHLDEGRGMRPHLPLTLLLPSLLALRATPARADPLFDLGQDSLEDRFVDGDLDEEDLNAARLGAHTASADFHGGTWISLVGFTKQLLSGRNDLGGMVVVGVAFDRIAVGPVHHVVDPPKPVPPPPPPSPAPPPPATPTPAPAVAAAVVAPDPVSPALARGCVAAALRTSGLGTNDAKLDELVSRARTSALLPETRMRAMRMWDDTNNITTLASTDTANFYDAVGANLVLELRLTWRFDRLLYAGDEPTIERVRLERQDARTRVATHVLEVLFTWQRAQVAVEEAPSGSRELVEAHLRVAEAEATLDVLTGGWFSQRRLDPG
jgi:hypothetical protein